MYHSGRLPLGLGQEEGMLQLGIPVARGLGVTVLGAPVGCQGYVREVLEARVTKIKAITTLLPNLEKPHIEFSLLRSCLSLPNIMFNLRTVDCTGHQDILQEISGSP